jgi:cobalt-zinc-cadmium efflux system protein
MSNHNHHLTHNPVEGKNLFFSIFLNILITVAQVIGGLVSGSLALLSDALHNFSDVLSLVFSYAAHQLSKRKASVNQTFGYKRAEIIAAFVNAISLIIVALFLIFEAFQWFFNPISIQSNLVIWMSLLGIVANGLSAFLLKKDAHSNLNMKSAYVHLFSDMMASLAVLVGGILMKLYQIYWIDSVLTFAIAIYLIYIGYNLLIESSRMLMLFTPSNIDIKDIVDTVHQIAGVNKLHHIHVWYLNENELHLEAHLDCTEDIKMSQFNLLLEKIEEVLLDKFKINHVNIQPEYQKTDSKDFIVQD